MDDNFRLIFSMPIERFYRKILSINETGSCELVIESNIEQPGLPEIGRYATQISPDDAVQLRDRVLALADVSMPDEGPLQPGEFVFEVLLEQGGKTQTKVFDPHTVPKRHQVIGREIRDLEKKARTKMVSGMRLGLGLSAPQIDREAPVGVFVQFSDVGKDPISFFNPLSPPDQGVGKILLSGVRSDIKPADLQFYHRQAHDLTARSLQKENSESMKALVFDLNPKEALSLKFNVILDWPPGSYNVEIIMDTTGAPEKNKNFIIGRITTPSQPLVITGASKPGDEGATHYEPPKL